MPQHETHGSDEPLMSHGTINRQAKRRIGLTALAVMAAALIAAEPCSAQDYWGGWGGGRNYGGYRSYGPQRDFFFPFSGFNRPPPVSDSTKAPASRKLETPPANTVMVVGDSMADWLAYGLDELYTDEPSVGFERKIRASSGLIRYDAKNEALDWSQATKDALANARPNAIIVMLGLNDRIPLRDKAPPQPAGKRAGEPAQGGQAGQPTQAAQGQSATPAANQPAGRAPQDKAAAPIDTEASPQSAQNETPRPTPGGSYDFHTEQWATLYAKRVDQMIAALKSTGAPVIWVGLPAIRGPKSTGDMSYLDMSSTAPAPKGRELSMSTFGTALLTIKDVTRCKDRTSRDKSGGCVAPMACISQRPEQSSSQVMSTANCAARCRPISRRSPCLFRRRRPMPPRPERGRMSGRFCR